MTTPSGVPIVPVKTNDVYAALNVRQRMVLRLICAVNQYFARNSVVHTDGTWQFSASIERQPDKTVHTITAKRGERQLVFQMYMSGSDGYDGVIEIPAEMAEVAVA